MVEEKYFPVGLSDIAVGGEDLRKDCKDIVHGDNKSRFSFFKWLRHDKNSLKNRDTMVNG